ncbi:unnamed protein product [Prorocentrum cordatum]|uniref:Pentatricopeptide repeat-containing protein n=1 Tax=Prorocentrum cordatum TaxID=2364126 RepID=A0ABN9SFU1_9DINO|nr:unnamed protein product [Polarella glacialis]
MRGAGNHDMQINVLMFLLVVVFALSKVTQDEGMVEFWIILMPVLTYAIGCANARKKQADLKLRLVSEMRESSTPESTLSVFDDMVEQGLAPDEAAFNKALCACARLGKIDRAMQVREQMPLHGFLPGAEANVAMIRACTSAGRVGEALDIFEELRPAQPPRVPRRDPLLHRGGEARAGRHAVQGREMAQSDMLPCAKTFQRLSGAVHEQGWAETAAELREVFAGWVKRTGSTPWQQTTPPQSSARTRGTSTPSEARDLPEGPASASRQKHRSRHNQPRRSHYRSGGAGTLVVGCVAFWAIIRSCHHTWWIALASWSSRAPPAFPSFLATPIDRGRLLLRVNAPSLPLRLWSRFF